jgi:hypothetical protein
MARTRTLQLRVSLPQGDPDIGAEIDCVMDVLYTPETPSRHWDIEPGQPADLQLVKVRPVHAFDYFVELQQDSLDSLAEFWLETDEAYDMARAESFIDRRTDR